MKPNAIRRTKALRKETNIVKANASEAWIYGVFTAVVLVKFHAAVFKQPSNSKKFKSESILMINNEQK